MASFSNEQDERDLQCLDSSSPPVFHRILGGSSLLVQQKSSTQLFVAEESLNTVENNNNSNTPEETMIDDDDHPSSSTDESDLDAFLEYARNVIEENNMSYDSASFEDFEDLLQECIANHFLDDSNTDDDSMTSESSFSGYANDEGCDSSIRYKTARIIARKKTKDTAEIIRVTNYYNNETESSDDSTSETSINSAQFKVHDYVSNINSFTELSDSSSSIVNENIPRQPRRRNIRNKKGPINNIKKTIITDSSSLNLDSDTTPNEVVGTKISTLLNSPRSKENVLNFLNKNAPTLHNSVVTRLRLEREDEREDERECKINTQKAMTLAENFGNESVNFHTPEKQQYRAHWNISPVMNIDTSNVILPSMIKKETITDNTMINDDEAGIIFMKITDHVLNGMLERQVLMNRKRQVLHQLNEIIDSKIQEKNFSQRGMALIHKIRARRKVALQAVFLRNSKEEQGDLKQKKTELSIPTFVEDEFSEKLSLSFQEPEDLMTVISLSPISSVEEKKQWLGKLKDKRKPPLSSSLRRQDKESLLQNESFDQCFNASKTSTEEAIPISKASPFKKITFSRSKIDKNYEALSPESSLTNGSSSGKPTSDTSSVLKTLPSSPKNSRYKIPEYVNRANVTPESSDSVSLFSDYNPCDSSDNINDKSCWSEMSFLSDTNRFTDSSASSPRLLVHNGSSQNSHGSQTHQYHDGLVPSPQRNVTRKSYNDSFDEIVLRNTPGKNLSIGLGILSPTGVMDLISVVGTDEEDHVFTDKEDSYVMKLPESSPYYQPIFLTSRRFEV